MVAVYFLQFYFVCSHCVAPGENFKAQGWDNICRRQLLLDKLSTRIHLLFVSSKQTGPIGWKIIKDKSTLQLQEQLCVEE
jgi:hypothetical protein